MEPVSLAKAQQLWEPAGTYLNTASFGLPPRGRGGRPYDAVLRYVPAGSQSCCVFASDSGSIAGSLTGRS